MTILTEFAELEQHLQQFGQEHLLAFWNELSENEREILKKDINDIDFSTYFKDLKKAEEKSALNRKKIVDDDLEPPSPDVCGRWSDCSEEQLENYNEIGLKYISNGEYCAILMAGGAGTRLGVRYPKGMYNVGLPSGKSLFQLQAERLLRLQRLALAKFGRTCPITWYIMTSDCTGEATMEYFKDNNHFGLQPDQIIFFEQFTLPTVGCNGKIILETKYKISKSPDGNGGLYRALYNYKLVDDMKFRGIKYALVYGVDNILVKIADPVFLGFCVEKGAECAAKVVEKVQPKEAVGIIGKVNGKYQVIEYSEISMETATLRDIKDNKLIYRCGNICTHLFSVDFLSQVCRRDINDLMIQHIAIKKVPFMNIETGLLENPEKDNAVKMEKFVFDVFPHSKSFAIWEVERSREFTALKNAPGSLSDCPETAKADLLAYHRQLILENLNNDFNLQEKVNKCIIELSPLMTYSGEDLENISSLIRKSGDKSTLHFEVS